MLVLTSPVGILTRAALTAFPNLRSVGICELPWTTLRDCCRCFGVDPGSVEFTYYGVNHWGWFTSIVSAPVRSIVSPLPLKYVNLLLDPETALRRQREAAPRGKQLEQSLGARTPSMSPAGGKRSSPPFGDDPHLGTVTPSFRGFVVLRAIPNGRRSFSRLGVGTKPHR